MRVTSKLFVGTLNPKASESHRKGDTYPTEHFVAVPKHDNALDVATIMIDIHKPPSSRTSRYYACLYVHDIRTQTEISASASVCGNIPKKRETAVASAIDNANIMLDEDIAAYGNDAGILAAMEAIMESLGYDRTDYILIGRH